MKSRARVNFVFFFSTLMIVLGAVPWGARGQAFTTIHHFGKADGSGTNVDGGQPLGKLVFSNGKLYGTTSATGPGYGGTVFAMNPDGTGFTNVHVFAPDVSFNYPNGFGPQCGLTISNGVIYGTTLAGGAAGWGTVFKVNTDGFDFAVVHSFVNGAGGNTARGGLVLAGGRLYGTTEAGNSLNQGIVYAVGTDGSGFTNLHGFSATAYNASTIETNYDGKQPNKYLVISGDTLYGTAQYGGTNGYGTLFSLNTNGSVFTVLHTFTAIDLTSLTNTDGANPSAGLLLMGNKLYGNTRVGGAHGFGTVFVMNTDGSGFTNLYSLTGENANSANAGLVLSSNTLYGVTFGTTTNSTFDDGGIYSVGTNGVGFNNLYEFSGLMTGNTNKDGSEPWDSLIMVSNVLYGTTRNGGMGAEGVVFKLDLTVPPPPIQFTASPTNGSIDLMVQFTSPGVDANGHTIGSWHWDFGDGGMSAAQNPMYEYDVSGTYMPVLVATNIRGGVVSATGPEITALPIPTVYYSADVTNGAAPLTVHFSADGSDTLGNTIVSWWWDFGDGGTGTGQYPTHIYSTTGDYSVTLRATNELGGWVQGNGPAAVGVTEPVMSGGGHKLLAYYNFDDGELAATDVSGNGNYLGFPFEYNGGSGNLTEDALTPPLAVDFDNNGGAGRAYYYTSSSNLLAALSGSFSVSLWVKTSQSSGSDTDNGAYGNAGIVSTFEQYVVPMSITGDKLCFLTAYSSVDALHSTTAINSNVYTHVVVTRDESTGEKKMYVNGALDASDVAETGTLPSGVEMEIGANNGTGFSGEMDEIQIYSGVLSAGEVAQLYNNPGTTIPDGSGGADLGVALNATNLVWTTGGDSDWFVETDTTHDGVSAAQSGPMTDSQSNWVETVVPANGQVSFWWKVGSEQDFDYLRFYINGVEQDEISGDVDWTQDTFDVAAGATLRWEYSKDESNSEPPDAGWLDEVQYTASGMGSPVNVSINVQIERYHDYGSAYEDFEAFPSINMVDPAPTTTNRLVSPDGLMYSEVWAGDTSSDNGNGEGFLTLDQLIYACTNGTWTLYINKDSVAEQVYYFKMGCPGLTTNLLGPVIPLSPAPNGTVSANAEINWLGPTNMQGIFLEIYHFEPTFGVDGFTNLAGTYTNWPSPPTLTVTTNELFMEFYTYGYSGVTFTTPVDGSNNPIAGWSTEVDLFDYIYMPFVTVEGGPAAPIEMTLLDSAGVGSIGFSFPTANGSSETVEMSTNLPGGWSEVTNFTGDGSMRQFTFPTTNGPMKFYRVKQQ